METQPMGPVEPMAGAVAEAVESQPIVAGDPFVFELTHALEQILQ